MSDAELAVGVAVAGRYEISAFTGEGRTGTVYAALDREGGEKVAVKLLHAPLCAVEDQVKRFEREFHLTSNIDHPHIVRMLAFGAEATGPLAGRHYLVMEHLDGRSLTDVLGQDRRPKLPRLLEICAQVASALAAAHAQGVVHRDVNPSNVLLLKRRSRRECHVKVLDFGLARLEDSTDELTGVGERLGTAAYMAPEYISGQVLDHRGDLYALGIILFEMLVGAPPFQGPSMRVLAAHVHEPVPRPSAHVPAVPAWLDELVLELLSKDPAERPQSAEALAARLEEGRALLTQTEAPARTRPPDSVEVPVVQGPEGVAASRGPEVPVYARPSSTRGLLWAATVGMALAAAVAAGLVAALVVVWLMGP